MEIWSLQTHHFLTLLGRMRHVCYYPKNRWERPVVNTLHWLLAKRHAHSYKWMKAWGLPITILFWKFRWVCLQWWTGSAYNAFKKRDFSFLFQLGFWPMHKFNRKTHFLIPVLLHWNYPEKSDKTGSLKLFKNEHFNVCFVCMFFRGKTGDPQGGMPQQINAEVPG